VAGLFKTRAQPALAHCGCEHETPGRTDEAAPSFAPPNRDEEYRHKGEQKYNGTYVFRVHAEWELPKV
jgi:hypothetical protein